MLRRSGHNIDTVGNVGETKPILRLESIDDFDRIPKELRDEICQQLGVKWDRDNFDIRVIAECEKYASHYIRRVNAVNAGAQFLLDSLKTEETTNKLEELQSSLNTLSEKCCQYLTKLDSNDIKHYQNSLVHYSSVLTTMLALNLGISSDAVIKQLDRAEQFATANQKRPAICTISRPSGLLKTNDFIVQLDVPENPFTTDTIIEMLKIKNQDEPLPAWFSALNESDKKLLRHFLSQHEPGDFGYAINAISSKLRIIPAPANYGKHTLITLLDSRDQNGAKLTVHPSEYRSSHIASRDVPTKHADVRHTHAYQNLKREIDDAIAAEIEKRRSLAGNDADQEIVIPILYQTLITPLKEPDSSLDKDRLEAATAIIYELNEFNDRTLRQGEPRLSFTLITSNHPLNYGKYAMPTTSWSTTDSSTSESIDLLLWLMRAKYTNPDDPRHELFDVLESNTMKLWSMEPYRELYLSSLEQLVISECDGISIGSCVSGKDRKAVEIAHTDALKIYFELYKHVPPLIATNSEDGMRMKIFAEIFADIYCTKHQMAIADLNAPGSFGIKTPSMYLPNHLQSAIEKWYADHATFDNIYKQSVGKDLLKESDIMASNNEVKHFKPRSLSTDEADLSWRSTALHLSEDYSIALMINMAKQAAKYYLNTRHERIGLFARWSGNHAGECRAQLCNQLLDDKETDNFHKIIFIHTLISSGLGENLITDAVRMMAFESVDTAKSTLQDYINLTASHQGIHDTKPIHDCAEQIHKQLQQLSKPEQVPASLAIIKKAFTDLAPRKDSSPKL